VANNTMNTLNFMPQPTNLL